MPDCLLHSGLKTDFNRALNMTKAHNSAEIVLRNGRLRARVLPHEGGRIASLFDTRSGVEFLFQPPGPYQPPAAPDLWTPFETSACAGIDDCLPTVSASGPETPGGPVPDHGDFWRLACTVLASDADSVTLAAEGYSRPLRLQKTLRLRPDSLEISYVLRNLSAAPVPFLYALHPLLAIDPGDRILLPHEITSLTLNYSKAGRLGKPGDTVRWPHPNPARPNPVLDLQNAQPVTAHTADMFYSPRLLSGWCGLYRSRSGRGLILRFNPRQLPWIGLWLCYGGWPDDSRLPRQYAVAFEPTVAPHGSLAAAIAAGQAPVLAPDDSFKFALSIEVTEPYPISHEKFTALCSRNT